MKTHGICFATARATIALASVLAFAGAFAIEPGAPSQPAATPKPTLATWAERREHGGVFYFLFGAPARIDRYDTVTSAWLPSITLDSSATAFDVDDTGIYLSDAAGVLHLDLAGNPIGLVAGVPGAQSFLDLTGDVLLTGAADTVASYSKTTGAAIDSVSCFFDITGYSMIGAEGKLFAVDVGVSPADILVTTFDPASGELGTCTDSPYHGAFPYATTTYARAEGGIVIDDNGTAYASADLTYLGSLGGGVEDIAYLSDSFVAMRGAELERFSYDLRELGRAEPPPGFVDVAASGGSLYAITSAGGTLSVDPFELDRFAVPVPPTARPWFETAGKADAILGDASDLIFVNRTEHAAYAFSTVDWSIGNPVPLFVAPELTAYSAESQRIYASYDGGSIYAFPLQQPGTAEYLASTVYAPNGLATAGEFVLASDYSGAWDTHFTFAPDGTRISRVDWNYYSREYAWDPIRRRMYFFRDDTSPDDLHWEEIAVDGSISDAGESPYHGEVIAQTPIRVSPDGGIVIIGSGQVFETSDLLMIGGLGHTVADVAWSGAGDLYALDAGDPALLRFSPSFDVVSSGHVRGTPRRLLRYGSGFLYVADVGSTTIVGVLDAFLSKGDLAVDPIALGTLFAPGSPLAFDVTLGNNGTAPSNGATVAGDLSALDQASWQCIADTSGVQGCDGSVHDGAAIATTQSLDAGAQVHYHVTGFVRDDAFDSAAIPFSIMPAAASSDPELRNNATLVRIELDELFRGTFDGS